MILNTQVADADSVSDVVNVLRVLADPTRLRLIALLHESEINVNALCDELNLAQPTVSHHLGLLRNVGLVTSRRDGKRVFYTVNGETVRRLSDREGIAINAGPVDLQVVGRRKPAQTMEHLPTSNGVAAHVAVPA